MGLNVEKASVRDVASASAAEFEVNARKYKNLSEVSKATATRDLEVLVRKGVLRPIGVGRSARYALRMEG